MKSVEYKYQEGDYDDDLNFTAKFDCRLTIIRHDSLDFYMEVFEKFDLRGKLVEKILFL